MRNAITIFLCLTVAFFVSSCKVEAPAMDPQVAGSFYPGDRTTLTNTVDSLLAKAGETPEAHGRLLTLLSPHAGYQYSGWVAAYGYKHLENIKDIDTVILIGPTHVLPFNGASVYIEGGFKTPLGEVKIDEELAASLLNKDADVIYLPAAFQKEHALEVQLPFLQRALTNFKIVPILISRPTREMMDHLIKKLTQILAERKGAIIVASSDMSHYYNYSTALQMDKSMIEALERISIIEIESLLMNKKGELCGAYPVMVALEASKRLGANTSQLLKYGNSGDVLPEKNSVVGYSSMGFYKSDLTDADKQELLRLARQAIVERVKAGSMPVYETDNPRLRTDGAVFVTIKRHGALRGCIGHTRAFLPLYQSVIKNAVNASSNDHRFTPMTPEELDDMEIEISVLSPLVPVQGIEEIELGKHGVFLVVEQASALFLPQVAIEEGWDREEQMRQLSIKAGLKPNAWKDGQIYVFEAEVFSENVTEENPD